MNMNERMRSWVQDRLPSLLLRAGLAFVFAYAALSSFAEPDAWIGYFPIALRHLVPATVLLNGFSIFELLLAAWLLLARNACYAAILAGLMTLGIVIANFGAMDIVFRDVAIAFMAAALAAMEWGN